MSDGLETVIGEKGINLSGGQRARVSLARALYYDAQIYLIDDPLSAVDTNVAKQLFDNCINGFLKSKIKILVTHHVQHLAHADQIILLNDDGEVVAKGKYDDLLREGINLNSYLQSSTHAVTTSPIRPMTIADLETIKRNPSIKKEILSGSISTLNTLFELEKFLPGLDAAESVKSKAWVITFVHEKILFRILCPKSKHFSDWNIYFW